MGRRRRSLSAPKRSSSRPNEQKQAIIHRAVTRGLTSNVNLKPSGVLWIGDIPAGWDVTRLRNISRRITSGSRGWSRYAADHGPLFVRIANLSALASTFALTTLSAWHYPGPNLGRRRVRELKQAIFCFPSRPILDRSRLSRMMSGKPTSASMSRAVGLIPP